MWVSLFYACGSVTLAVAASFKKGSSVHPYIFIFYNFVIHNCVPYIGFTVYRWLDFVGLFIISLGTGGIKPSVSPFGGDQFKKGQVILITRTSVQDIHFVFVLYYRKEH